MNALGHYRVAFMCSHCDMLHEVEGTFLQTVDRILILMQSRDVGGFVVSDAVAATIVDQDAYERAKLKEKELCGSLNAVIKAFST